MFRLPMHIRILTQKHHIIYLKIAYKFIICKWIFVHVVDIILISSFLFNKFHEYFNALCLFRRLVDLMNWIKQKIKFFPLAAVFFSFFLFHRSNFVFRRKAKNFISKELFEILLSKWNWCERMMPMCFSKITFSLNLCKFSREIENIHWLAKLSISSTQIQ